MSRRFRPGLYNLDDESQSSFSSSSDHGSSSSVPSSHSSSGVISDMNEESRSSSSIISESIITTKGGRTKKKYEINMDELGALISDLRYYSDEKVHRISGEIKTKFTQLKEIVELLYPTNSYSILVDIVLEHFEDMEAVIPGTIGAYCVGCKENRGDSNIHDYCAPACAGAMPHDQDDRKCKETVILAHYEKGKYHFSLLRDASSSGSNSRSVSSSNPNSNSDNSSEESGEYSSSYNTFERSKQKDEEEVSGYVFVPHKDLEEFRGFTRREKRNIMRMGIDHVKLYGYDDDDTYGNHYRLDSNHVNEIKERKGRRGSRKNRGNNKNSEVEYDYTWLIVFIIIIVLVAVFLLSNHMRYGRL